MAMDPERKKLLMIGIPVVVGIALIFLLKSKSSSTAATAATTGTTGTIPTSNNGAVDVGQLSAFESTVSDQLAQILAGQSSTPPPTPPPTTGTPSGPVHPIGPAWPVQAAPAAPSAPDPATLPGYGAGVSALEAANGGSVAAAPGIAGQQVTYNGVPIS